MLLVVVPSVKLGVTFNPPHTGLSSVTVNASWSPSSADASAIVTAGALSSSKIVPVAVPAATVADVPETLRLTVKVSSVSLSASSIVATMKVCVSPSVPAKVMAVVFSV